MIRKLLSVLSKPVMIPLLALSISQGVSQGQSLQTGDKLPKHVLQKDCVAVAKLNLSAIKPTELIELFSQTEDRPDQAAAAMSIKAAYQTLTDAGVTAIYATVPASVIPHGGICLIIPCSDTQVVANFARGLTGLISKPFAYVVVELSDQVIVCPQAFEARLSEADSVDVRRDDITEGLQSVAALPHQAVLSLSTELHQTLSRILPEELGKNAPIELSPKTWVNNVRTISIGWDMPPDMNVLLAMTSVDANGAKWAAEEISRVAQYVPGLASSLQTSVRGNQATATIKSEALSAFLDQLIKAERQTAQQAKLANNIRQVGMAMHNYYDAYNRILPPAIMDNTGKPLLSWRVALLPYLGEGELFSKFKLDEPWDSEHNKELLANVPEAYADPAGVSTRPGMTRLRLPVIDGSIWSEKRPLKFKDVTDGTSNTIWLIHAPVTEAVEWTNPQPWSLDPDSLKKSIFGDSPSTYAGYADTSVQILEASKSIEWLKYRLQYADGNLDPDN